MKKHFKTKLLDFLIERNMTFKTIGQDVANLQTALTKMGFSFPIHGIDGKVGPETLGVVGYFYYIVKNELKKMPTNITFDNVNISDNLSNFILNTSKDQVLVDSIKEKLKEETTKIESYHLPPKMLRIVKKYVPNTEAFLERVKSICTKILCRPEDLIRIMYYESGLNPKARNKSSNATGLIQFMPKTSIGLGTTVDDLMKMDHIQQLGYVEKYLIMARNNALRNGQIHQGQILKLGDLYSAVFMPSFIGRKGKIADEDSLVAKQNPSLKNSEGDITKDSIEDNLVANTTRILGPADDTSA